MAIARHPLSRAVSVGVLLIPCLFSQACATRTAGAAAAAGARLAVSISATEIGVNDPLFLKVEVSNDGPHAIDIDPRLGSEFGTVYFEMRSARDPSYARIDTKNQGMRDVFVSKPTSIEPASSQATFETLFTYYADVPERRRFVFAEAGTYQIRASVTIGAQRKPHLGFVVSSDPVTVVVKPVSDRRRCVTEAWEGVLTDVFGVDGVPTYVHGDLLTRLQEKVGPSTLDATIEWFKAVADIQHTPPSERHLEPRVVLENARKSLDAVTAELIGLALAREYMEREEWASAKSVLNALGDESHQRTSMDLEVSRHLPDVGNGNKADR